MRATDNPPIPQIRQLTPLQLPLINKFYQTHKVRGRARRHDKLWVAQSDNRIVAALRITPSSKDPEAASAAPLLCGVYVSDAWRHRGLASRLIREAVSHQGATFTFAYRHLTGFYQALGFTLLTPEQLSASLAGRFTTYTRQGRDIVPLVFDPNPNRSPA